jgi:hypothetical protein
VAFVFALAVTAAVTLAGASFACPRELVAERDDCGSRAFGSPFSSSPAGTSS